MAIALNEDIERSTEHLRGAMHGLSDRLREMSGLGGAGYSINRRFREGNLDSGELLTPLATELAVDMAGIVGECAALDAKRELAQRLDG